MRYNYRDTFNRIKECVEQWMNSDPSSFKYKQYLWIRELDGQLDVALCETDTPSEGMTEILPYTDFDYDTCDLMVGEDAVHATAREWCFGPTVQQSHNYKIPEILTEDILTELCERFRDVIAAGNLHGMPEINVRYAVRDGMFHVAKFGDYFFLDEIMYVCDRDKKWAPYHDEFAAKAFFGDNHDKRGYVHAVAFCGIQLPFLDDKGDAVFTGDVCKCYNDIYRVVTANEFEGYGFRGDNCMILLDNYPIPLHRVGTIFYKLSLDAPMKNTWIDGTEICSMWGQADNIGELLAKAKLTPSFMKDDFEYFVLSYITEEYDWRIIFDRSQAYPTIKNYSMKKFIKETLQELLNSLNDGFDEGELAYLSSQGKNEIQIRDKIAWRLHKEINARYGDIHQYVVRREWGPESLGKKRVDLAILELNPSLTKVKRAIALIEFKAQSIVRPEKWYLDEFKNDVKKMRDLVQDENCTICKDADMYFVFLETGQNRKADEYKPVLAYAKYQTSSVKYRKDSDYLSAIKSHWDEFSTALGQPITIHQPKAISIGKAFGYEQFVSPLLIGPLK